MQDKFLICQTEDAKNLPLPNYMTSGSSGLDLYANIDGNSILKSGKILLVSVGIKISIPQGYEAQVRPRSGLAYRYGISLVNTPGTIDSDYRGEIKVILINHGEEDFLIKRGDRIAQMIINKVEIINFVETDFLEDETERGGDGFGHTGTN